MAMRQFMNRFSTLVRNDTFLKVRDFVKHKDVRKYLMYTAGIGGVAGGMRGFNEVDNHNHYSKESHNEDFKPNRVHDAKIYAKNISIGAVTGPLIIPTAFVVSGIVFVTLIPAALM